MEKQGLNVQLSIKEIYSVVCPDCKEKIKEMVRDKISDQMVDQVIGAEAK